MISEESCDTVDWSNDISFAITGMNYILKCFQNTVILDCN